MKYLCNPLATSGEVLDTLETVDNVTEIVYDDDSDRVYAVGAQKLTTYYHDMYKKLTRATDIDLKSGIPTT